MTQFNLGNKFEVHFEIYVQIPAQPPQKTGHFASKFATFGFKNQFRLGMKGTLWKSLPPLWSLVIVAISSSALKVI